MFTSRAQEAVVVARHAVRRRGASVVRPEDLLLGLVEAKGPAGRVLDGLGVTSAGVRRYLGIKKLGSGSSGEVLLSDEVRAVLADAPGRATGSGVDEVDDGHLLLALLDQDDPRVRYVLSAGGASVPLVRDRLLAAMNLPPASPRRSTKVFVSYRRQGTSHVAGRIADRLVDRFGEQGVFMDVDSIGLGTDFTRVITDAVASCTVLLAIIGPDWAAVTDARGRRRLELADDLVRVEVEAALRRDVPVIPVLVDGAEVPAADELPDGLRAVASRHGLRVRHESFRQDVARLLDAVAVG
ncbi:TIR domain-containing protein [Saccharothrix sp. Mg75]|uniref:toll/interleukin-1 receptor domain-containing protein n=1 Tax=Saccharothrix sp. Mg75 TaxID=3445357 RepID=UPI003EECAD7E